MKITVEVTQQDIEHGKYNDPKWCPIALAARRTTGRSVRVLEDAIRIVGSDDSVAEYQLPYEARRFVAEFDKRTYGNKEYLKPFSFELELA